MQRCPVYKNYIQERWKQQWVAVGTTKTAFVQVTEVRSVGSSTLWMCTDIGVACHYLVAVSQVVSDLQKSQVVDCPPLWLLLTVASTDFTLFYENLSDRPCLLYNKMQEVTVNYPVQLC